MKSLKGKRVLITGAARGIGAELARQLSKHGARVALVGLEPERLAALAEELGPEHLWAEADVTDYAALEKAVQLAITTFGGLDVVVPNAGISAVGTVAISPVSAMVKTIEVNVIGVIHTVSATLPALTESQGYLLLMASAVSLISMPGAAAYSASKVAVEHFGDALRLEVAHKGVGVGVMLPCWVDTDMVRDQKNDLDSFHELLTQLPWPFYRESSVEECAEACMDAIVHRRRKLGVPWSITLVSAFRQFYKGAIWDFIVSMSAKGAVVRAEEEIGSQGRFFGPNSVGPALIKKDKPK
jgi:short-subunit dehydrogenase